MKIQNQTARQISTLTIAIACSAGMALPAIGQSSTSDHDSTQKQLQAESRTAETSQTHRAVYNFQRLSTLMGAEVVSRDGTEVATIDDLILDRGTGEVSHVVTLSNDILGLGGDRVAVPFSEFRFDMAERLLSLDLTQSQIENFGEQIPGTWTRIESGDLDSELGKFKTMARDEQSRSKPDWYGSMNDKAETIEISGPLLSVDRETTDTGEEFVVLSVRDTSSDSIKKIATGPSWFVIDGDNALRRNTDVEMKVVSLATNAPFGYAACDVEAGETQLTLWNDDWKPAWHNSQRAGDRSGMITASHLMGIGVSAHDDTAGEIQDGIIELGSGKLAVLLLDPNENLFGIGDELKCVPWTVSSVGADRVHIDGTVDTLKACKAAPDDLTLISTPVTLRPVYEVFDVYVVDFEPREQTTTTIGDGLRGG